MTKISGPATDRDNPWPGLSSFTEETRALFFGREKETDELSRLVRRETLTVLFGQSGLGKSSLLQAGLFPLLRENDHLPLYLRLDHDAAAAPLAEQVKAALRDAFAREKVDAPALSPTETLWEYFHRKDVDIWSAKNRLLTPVLAFDQFEEIFTLGRADEARRERSRAFLAALADLVENRPPATLREKFERGEAEPMRYNFDKPSCRVILSLREDFLPDLEGLKQSLPALIHNRLRLKRLNGAQALEAVARPAPQLLAEGVGEKIVEFVAGARGGSAERLLEMEVEPALLSVICRELNERRRSLGQAQITADLVSGNRREILTDFYERSVGDLPETMRAFIEDHLLTKSGFRDNLALETALELPGVTRPLLDTLVSRRLLRIEERAGVQRVELTHDVLADVVRASRDSRQQRLAAAESVRKARRMRFAIAGLVAAVIVLSAGAVFGLRAQRRSAVQAGHTDLVLGSRLLDESKLAEGLAYLVRAARKDPTNEIIAPRLLSTLTSHTYLFPTGVPLQLPSPALDASYTIDGRWIVVQGEDDVVRVIDVAAWRVVHALNEGQKVRRGAVALAAKNPSVLAVVRSDSSILVCDIATGQPRGKPLRPPEKIAGQVPEFQLSPDGRWLAAAGPNDVWVWDTASSELKVTLPSDGYYRLFAFSPDSQLIATTNSLKTTQWSLVEQKAMRTPIEIARGIVYPLYSSDGSSLMIWAFAGVTVYDAKTGTARGPMIPITSPSSISGIWISRDGKKVICATTNRNAQIFDVTTGKEAYPALTLGGNISPWSLRLVADEKVLFTNSVDGMQRLWDLDTGRLLAEPTLKQPQYVPSAVSPDGKNVVVFTAGGAAYRLRLGGDPAAPLAVRRTRDDTLFINLSEGVPTRLMWLTYSACTEVDVATGRETGKRFTFSEPVTNGSRSPYGGTLGRKDVVCVQTKSRVVRAWTMGENGIANDVALEDSADAIVGNGVDSSVHRIGAPFRNRAPDGTFRFAVWDSMSGRKLATFQTSSMVSTSASSAAGFSPDGKRVLYRTSDDAIVHVGDIASGQEAFALQLTGKAALQSLRYSPDGKRIFTGDSWGGIQIWDATTGKQLRSAQSHRTAVQRFDFSNDQRFYASVSSDGTAQIWDARTDQPVGAPLEQNGGAARADFSPDNTRIVTPSASGSARIWDVRTGLPITEPLNTEKDSARVVAFSPDAKYVEVHDFAGAAQQFVRLWSVPARVPGGKTPEWLLTLATICAGHRLTDDGKLIDDTESLGKIEEVKRALAAAPANDTYAEWGRWILSESPTRSIAPGFVITPAEAAKFRGDWLRENPARTGAGN